MKRAAVSTDEESLSKATGTGVVSDARCLEHIPVPRRIELRTKKARWSIC